MEYLELPEPNILLISLGVVGLVIFIAMVLITTLKKNLSETSVFLWALVGTSGLVAAIILPITGFNPQRGDEIPDQIEETYGLELDAYQIQDLEYPRERPTADFQVYGSTTMDLETETGFNRVTTYLLWKDGKMILASQDPADTDKFQELQLEGTEAR